MANTLKDLMEFFGTPERPVSSAEFSVFWKSCSEELKAEFKNAELR
jgi:hypothetical protein